MTLPPPNLDDRDFQSLVEEARARIPTFTAEWTDLNESDPGMMLVELHAWLTETLLYRVNRLPDLAYVNFLNLLGSQPEPARAAQAELSFKFTKLDGVDDPLTLLVPRRVQVGVDDPNLTEPLTFETDETLRGINAAIASIFVRGSDPNDIQLIGSYDEKTANLELPGPFRPFGEADRVIEGREPVMCVGLLLRPFRKPDRSYLLDRFPEGELNLSVLTPQVFEKNSRDNVIEGPLGSDCPFPWEIADAGNDIVWEVYQGTDPETDFDDSSKWVSISLRGDDSAGLKRSGHVYLDIPPNLPPVPYERLPRDFWTDLGLTKAPATNRELRDDLQDGILAATDLDVAVWKDVMGLADPPLDDPDELDVAIENAPELDFAAVDPTLWIDLGYSAAPVAQGLIWLRARLTRVQDTPPEVSALLLNTIRATAAVTRTTEVLGTSAGRPNQTFKLKRAPVLIDPKTGLPDVTIELVDGAGTQRETWHRGTDFFGAERDTQRYLLNPETGELSFGDGVNGMIPVAGTRIIATGYRVGGGILGNVSAGTISKLKTALPQVESVTNQRSAAAGSDAETLDQVKLRAPQLLRSRDRAVASEDFADLALRTPGVELKSAFALPLTRLDPNPDSELPPVMVSDSPGAVTVVVLPVNKEPTPQPSEDQLRLICSWMNERRLITTELYVTGPKYVKVSSLQAQILASPEADLKAVHDRCHAVLEQYFHPLNGGPAAPGEPGPGWPIGGDIYLGNVFDQLLSQAGVERVPDLKMALEGQPNDECSDVLVVDPGTLVHLPGKVIQLDVRYRRGS